MESEARRIEVIDSDVLLIAGQLEAESRDRSALETRVALLEARLQAAEERALDAKVTAVNAKGRAEMNAFETAQQSKELRKINGSLAELWREISRTTR